MKFSSTFCTVATLSIASAHTIMQRVTVGSTTYAQGEGIYMPSYDGFIDDVTSNSLACNGVPNTGFASSSAKLSVQAGDTVSGAWLHTLTSTGPDSNADNKVIDSSHKGPVITWMKKVSDATQNPSAGPGDGWFKIAEAGLVSPTQWAVDALISSGGIQTVQIPSCIEDGDYLLRFEIIALHSAYNYPGAQFYMECAQITVSGGSGASTPPTVALPGAYSPSDPGITINIYNGDGQPYPSSGQYTIPGPEVFVCGASGNSSISASAGPSTSTAATSSTSSAAPVSLTSSAVTAFSPTSSTKAGISPVSSAVAATSSTSSTMTTFVTSYQSSVTPSAPSVTSSDAEDCDDEAAVTTTAPPPPPPPPPTTSPFPECG